MKGRSWLDKVVLRRVTVHIDTGRSIEGNIADSSLDGVMLRACKLLGEPALGEQDADLDGECWIPRERVIFVQDVS